MVVVANILRTGLEKGVVRSISLAALALAVSACSPAATAPPPVEPTLDVPSLHTRASEPPGGGIRFGRVAPVVGARLRVAVQARSAASDPQGGAQLSEYISVYTVEILGTNGPAPSRVRLAFEKNVQRYQGVDRATVIDGKTYIIDADAPHVRDASGGAAAEEEAQRVLDVVPDLGTRTQIDQVLPESAMAIGDERHELAGAILRVIHPRAWSLVKGTAVLSRTETEEAVFAIALDATSESGLHMDVKGEARVRLRDARLTSIVLDGTYHHGEHANGSSSDPGMFSLRRTVSDL